MIRKGTKVRWEWGNAYATGEVKETYKDKVTKKLNGSEISRNGSADNKALFIEQKDGTKVLKLESEVQRMD